MASDALAGITWECSLSGEYLDSFSFWETLAGKTVLKNVMTPSRDSTARIWLWRSEVLLADRYFLLIHNLTPEEWIQYLGYEPLARYARTGCNARLTA